MTPFDVKKPFQNIVGKGENAGNQHFLLFPQFFLLLSKTEIIIYVTFILLSANAFNLEKVKLLLSGNELKKNIDSLQLAGDEKILKWKIKCK